MDNDEAFQESAVWAALIIATEKLGEYHHQCGRDIRQSLIKEVLKKWEKQLPEGYATVLSEHLEEFKTKHFPSRWQL